MSFLKWGATQLTFLQYYHPDFLRGYGVGVLNGSLWTIPVEMQFYVMTPILFFLYTQKKKLWFVVFALMIVLYLFDIRDNAGSAFWRYANKTFVPLIWMFMLGAFLSTRKDLILFIRKQRFLVLLALYALSTWLIFIFHWDGNGLHPIPYIFLAAIIINLGFNRPNTAQRILKKNDISYGIYIYHMPILNFALYTGLITNILSTTCVFACVILTATLSWFVIEKPMLRLKHFTLRRQ